MSPRASNLTAGWRLGLSRPVLILQAGNALNYFGYGLVRPFEIIYLHQMRGFSAIRWVPTRADRRPRRRPRRGTAAALGSRAIRSMAQLTAAWSAGGRACSS